MVEHERPSGRFTLQRWSRRKLAAARVAGEPSPPEPAPAEAATAPGAPLTSAEGTRIAQSGPPRPCDPAPELPSVETLSFESDFSAFLQPEVDETLRRQALKKLFADPRFNVMDGLDVYIDDYGKPDPISPDLVRQLVQGRYLFDPPRTRVNAQGIVEEVPVDEVEVPPAADETAVAEVAMPAEAAPLPGPGPSPSSDTAAQPDELPGVPVAAPTAEPRP